MSYRKSIRIAIDVVLIIFAVLPTLVVYSAKVSPKQQGFFCDDHSIYYPTLQTTVPSWVVAIVTIATSWLLLILTEVMHYRAILAEGVGFSSRRICGRKVNSCVYTIFSYYWIFQFGALATQSLTDICKYSIGKLRPSFLEECQPNVNLSSCLPGQYFTNFTCLAADFKEEAELRTAFPSGHASSAAYAAVFLVYYVQKRVPRLDYSYLLKHVIQFILMCMAWFCALSRVMDNKHHPTDVLAGALLGTVIALLCVVCVARSFVDPYRNMSYQFNSLYGCPVSQSSDQSSERSVDTTT